MKRRCTYQDLLLRIALCTIAIAASRAVLANNDLDSRPANRYAAGDVLGSAATLKLTVEPGTGDTEPGDFVVVTLWILDLEEEAAGFQAFLTFDSARLSFVTGNYTAAPFGLPIIEPVVADGEDIDLASGIHQLEGQTPTSDDAVIALLTFEALVPGCVTSVTFRDHEPPTRITDDAGNAIVPLELIGLPTEAPSSDIDGDGEVDIDDLLLMLAAWGPCPLPPESCLADVNCDGVVNIVDLLILLAEWGPVP